MFDKSKWSNIELLLYESKLYCIISQQIYYYRQIPTHCLKNQNHNLLR